MTTAVSAPGKVLLAGGYLVLDPKFTGLVFGLSARIHVLVRDAAAAESQSAEIEVESPQFREARWRYGYRFAAEGDGGVEVSQIQGSSSGSRNPFVETALLYALNYITALLGPAAANIKPTKITILADNDYYSNTSDSTIPGSTKFTDFAVRLQDAHKTGLGSSAALVTSFTGAVLTHYLPASLFSLSTEAGRSKLHNLAQIAHCAAQGKVGSGFDVAAAVYGTCIYRRFSPSILSSLGEPGTAGFSTRVRQLVDDEEGVATGEGVTRRWDVQISKGGVTIPDGLALVMCDVDCGSETVGMVKKVLGWRKDEPEVSGALWEDLQSRNERLAALLAAGGLAGLQAAFEAVRERIREMGEKSGVPIEPREQTELLDAATKDVAGVFGGVVPGAGGYDAIVLLVKDDQETKSDLDAFLKKWSTEKGGKVKLLKAKGELEGARIEGLDVYGELSR